MLNVVSGEYRLIVQGVILALDKAKLGVRALPLGVRGGGLEMLALIVFKPARLAAHDGGENVVDNVGHSAAASEILAQSDPRGVVAALVFGVSVASCEEDLGHRLAKAVDALLHVADHEKIAFIPREGGEYHILRLVDILIFVNEYLGVILRESGGERSSLISVGGLAHKQLQCEMQRVGEIGGVLLELQAGEFGGKVVDRADKLPHDGRKGGDVGGVLPGADGEEFAELLEIRLVFFADNAAGLLDMGDAASRRGAHFAECGGGIAAAKLVPFAALRGFEQR